jgi:hypothetical protein
MAEIGISSRNELASKISRVGQVTDKIIFLALDQVRSGKITEPAVNVHTNVMTL